MKVGDKVLITPEHIARASTGMQKYLKETVYARIWAIFHEGKSFSVDLYGEHDYRIVYNHYVNANDIIFIGEPDYTQELVMHDILVNLNKLEKKLKNK